MLNPALAFTPILCQSNSEPSVIWSLEVYLSIKLTVVNKKLAFFEHFDFDRSTLPSFFSYHLTNVTKQMPINHWGTSECSELQ